MSVDGEGLVGGHHRPQKMGCAGRERVDIGRSGSDAFSVFLEGEQG
jgi:hypothetical protein